jgi:general secretion pathway protein N
MTSTQTMKALRRANAISPVHAPWSLAWLGVLLGLVLALLVWAPARWLAWGVAEASQGQVQWLNPRGTVWQGSAQLLLSGGPGSRQPQALPGRLHWTLSPAWSGLRLGWRADCCMTQAASVQAALGWNTLHLQASDHRSNWPAALLTGLGAPWNTLQAEGQLQLRTEALQLHWAQGRLQMQGLLELSLQGMSSRLSPVKPMGSYRIALTGTPEGTPTPGLGPEHAARPLAAVGPGPMGGPAPAVYRRSQCGRRPRGRVR